MVNQTLVPKGSGADQAEVTLLTKRLKKMLRKAGSNNTSNFKLIQKASENRNVVLLRLYLDFLEDGQFSLHSVNWMLTMVMDERGYKTPETLLTPAKMDVYVKLQATNSFLDQENEGHDIEAVHLAAALSGETDVEFLLTLIKERRPVNDTEMMKLLESVRDVPKGLSSGAL